MILSALDAYYRRVAGRDDGPPPYGFDVAKVVGAVHLNADGGFLGLLDLREPDPKGKPRQRLMTVPRSPQRSGKVIKPAFLCDSAAFLLGVPPPGGDAWAEAKHEACRALHERLLGPVDHPVARAILGFFTTWPPEQATERLADWADLLVGWLVFHVRDQEEAFAHDVPAIREAWAAEVEAGGSDLLGQCLVTGRQQVPLARLHPSIKGVDGAQGMGAPLVSFNFDAAKSYGKEQSFNAPVAERTAAGYTAALNHLLRRDLGHARIIGDTTVAIWAEKQSAGETLLPEMLDPVSLMIAEANASDADKLRAQQVRDALDRVVAGQVPAALEQDQGVRFYVLGLAPNAARLSVRFWLSDTLGHLLKAIRCHQKDLELETDYPSRPRYPSLRMLVLETRAKDRKGDPIGGESSKTLHKLYGDLSAAALRGTAYPASLIPVLLARFRADGHVTHPRVALMKAILTRRWRLDQLDRQELKMSLDETRTETGYILGRLFAVLERLQQAAHGDGLNTTIRDKFTASASATPGAVFPYLLKLGGAHFKKARRERKGLAHVLDRHVADLNDRLTGFPATLSVEDQGLFFVGYYQQRQALWAKRGTGTEAETEPTTTDAA